jgi:hypothetical protein
MVFNYFQHQIQQVSNFDPSIQAAGYVFPTFIVNFFPLYNPTLGPV